MEAISLQGHHFIENEACINNEMLKNLPMLRLLELNSVRLNGKLKMAQLAQRK